MFHSTHCFLNVAISHTFGHLVKPLWSAVIDRSTRHLSEAVGLNCEENCRTICTIRYRSYSYHNLLIESNINIFFSKFLFLWGLRPNASNGILIHEVSRLHTRNATQSVGLLWTSDQPVAETSTLQHTIYTADIHASGRIRTHILSRRAAADKRFRPRGHRDWIIAENIHFIYIYIYVYFKTTLIAI